MVHINLNSDIPTVTYQLVGLAPIVGYEREKNNQLLYWNIKGMILIKSISVQLGTCQAQMGCFSQSKIAFEPKFQISDQKKFSCIV